MRAMRPALRRVAVRAGVVILAVVLALLAGYRDKYGSWLWEGPPDLVGWCGRDYDRDWGFISESELRGVRLYDAFRVPPLVGRQFVSDLSPSEQRAREEAGEVCGLLVLMRTDDGRYLPYELLGGP